MTVPRDEDPGNSQQMLAASIARAIIADLPQTSDPDELTGSVETALRKEALSFERTMANLRCGFLALLTIFTTVVWVDPQRIGAATASAKPPLVTAAALIIATGLLLVLRRGWYRSMLRKLIPLLDAAIITTAYMVLGNGMRPLWEQSSAGITALAAVACGFLAFSGSLRLSRSSGPFSTILACTVWFTIGIIADLRAIELLLIGLMIAATGVMGVRLTEIIRRVVTNEVTRMRLAKLYEDARESVSAHEEVLNIVSHDLRNPLNLIAMTTDLIRDEEIPGTERKRYLDMISRSGKRMNRMIQDLLDVARVERGRLAIEPHDDSLVAIVNDAIEMMAPTALERAIALDSEVQADLPTVHVDRERIIQLFSNLIGNAVKFTPKGGTVWIRARLQGDHVRVAVCDSGPGIPPDQVENIFASFWQAKKGDRRGLGLGLTIARAIVDAHGGQIGVESHPSSGAEFWFTLPVKRSYIRE